MALFMCGLDSAMQMSPSRDKILAHPGSFDQSIQTRLATGAGHLRSSLGESGM
jgi:hypothetical protein